MNSQPTDSNAGLELFQNSTQRAMTRQMSVVELFKAVEKLGKLNQKQRIVELYKAWIAYNPTSEVLYAVYFNYGVALGEVQDRAGSINAFREAIRLKPDFQQPYINLGRALEDAGQSGLAVEQWLALVNRLPAITGEAIAHKITALQQTGRVLESVNSDAAAEDALKQSLDIDPHQVEAAQHWISLRQRQCKWPVIEEWPRVSRKQLLSSISQLSLECLADDPMFQLARAYQYAKTSIGMPQPVARPIPQPHDRLRIGYVSSDLRDHAVGFAMTDVVETHDRDRVEVFAYYCGINRTDVTQQRIMRSVEHWVDINELSDDQAAAKIAADGIDILVDLNGYTKDARTKVFARRPAPIAVNWFGFPGTMGTPYHHYLIADDITIPEQNEIFFSEKILRLPCYQANDRKRPVSSKRPSRTEVGLPENAFVFCSLNGMQKITPRAFHRWMMILGAVPDSVLWILSGTDDTNARLRQLAANHGIGAERIVFAQKLANPDHLARYPLADLFLDNLPYGAHTTAADSMLMSVPILTLRGRSFAARVCSDVLTAAGLEDMICTTPEAYVQRAVELAHNRDKLSAVRARLAAGRESCLLFDTPKLVRGLEDLYGRMWADYQNGVLPVPDLRNMDVYHEIGVTLDLENIETLSDEAYFALYREKLAEWNSCYPIVPDARLWRGAQHDVDSSRSQRAVA